MSNLAGQRIKDTYDGVLHASGSSLTLGNGNSTDTIDANFNAVDVPVGGLKENGASHTSVSATTSVAGHVELATDAEAHAATDTTRAVTPSNLLIKKDGTAIVAGDFSGNSRGSSALDVQSGRSGSTPVASGSEALPLVLVTQLLILGLLHLVLKTQLPQVVVLVLVIKHSFWKLRF
jgi:hypothetical protein